MDWLEIVKQAGDGPFKVAMLGAILHGVKELSRMRKSVEALNLTMAVEATKVKGLDRRVTNLERKK